MLLAGGLFLLVLIFGGLIYMFNGETEVALRRLDEKKREVAEGQRIQARREEVMTLLAEDQLRLRFLEQGASDAAYVPTLLRQLEGLAVNTNNKVLTVRPEIIVQAPTRLEQRRDPNAAGKPVELTPEEKKKAAEPYTPLGVEVNLVGSYDSIQEFLQQIQRFPKIIAVQQLNVRPNVGEVTASGQQQVQAELRLKAFIMKENEAPSAPSAPAPQASAPPAGGGVN